MRLSFRSVFLVGIVAFSLSATAIAVVESRADSGCVAQTHTGSKGAIGYELIDVLRREAWVTLDWTVEEYAEFNPGLGALNWLKNDPRTGYADHARALKSPSCEEDGYFRYKTMFGKQFFHIADITGRARQPDSQGLIIEGRVVKYHSLSFDAGSIVPTLHAPNGDRFVGVNEIVGTKDAPKLPDGWVLDAQELTAPLEVQLSGEVRVLRLSNGSSFQATVDAGADE